MSPVSSTRKPAHTGGGTNPAGMETGGSKKLKKKEFFHFSEWKKRRELSHVARWMEEIPWIFLRVWGDPASPREAQRVWVKIPPSLVGSAAPTGIPEMRLSWKRAWKKRGTGIYQDPPAWLETFGHQEHPWVVKFEFRFGQERPGKDQNPGGNGEWDIFSCAC